MRTPRFWRHYFGPSHDRLLFLLAGAILGYSMPQANNKEQDNVESSNPLTSSVHEKIGSSETSFDTAGNVSKKSIGAEDLRMVFIPPCKVDCYNLTNPDANQYTQHRDQSELLVELFSKKVSTV